MEHKNGKFKKKLMLQNMEPKHDFTIHFPLELWGPD